MAALWPELVVQRTQQKRDDAIRRRDALRRALDNDRSGHVLHVVAHRGNAGETPGFEPYRVHHLQVLRYLRESQGAPTRGAIGPREFALVMIGITITAMILATIGHRRSMRALRADYGALIPYSLATIVAGLIGILGVILLVAVLLRM